LKKKSGALSSCSCRTHFYGPTSVTASSRNCLCNDLPTNEKQNFLCYFI